jgi:hypothetical protein
MIFLEISISNVIESKARLWDDQEGIEETDGPKTSWNSAETSGSTKNAY